VLRHSAGRGNNSLTPTKLGIFAHGVRTRDGLPSFRKTERLTPWLARKAELRTKYDRAQRLSIFSLCGGLHRVYTA